MQTLSDRLKRAMQATGMKPVDLANAARVTKSSVSQWLNDQTRRMDGKNLVAVATALGVREAWLMTGSGPMWAIQEHADTDAVHENNTERVRYITRKVPLISWVQAGEWHEATEPLPPGASDQWVMCPVTHGPDTFVLKVRGASMEPDYHDGDWLFVDPARAPNNGDDVIVRLDDDGEATFKRYITEGENSYLLAVNPGWPNRIIRINGSATVVGVVIFSGKPR